MIDAATALLAASAAHLGFQLVVTAVVYPALAEVEASRWPQAHAAHSRRIGWVVGALYPVVAVACGWALLTGPTDLWTLVSCAGNALAAVVTATVAAPAHGRLGREGPTPALLSRLVRADQVRTLGAAVAVGGALLA